MGPGVFVTSWPIRRSLITLSSDFISSSNLFTTRFGQLCHPQRGGAYPPRTRLGGDKRGEGHVNVARVFRDVDVISLPRENKDAPVVDGKTPEAKREDAPVDEEAEVDGGADELRETEAVRTNLKLNVSWGAILKQ